eukprot:2647946-Pyramimonas_sp.AAC.1
MRREEEEEVGRNAWVHDAHKKHVYIIATLLTTAIVYIMAPVYTTGLVMCTAQCLRTPAMP